MKSTSDAHGQVWAIVLASDEGIRPRPLIHRLHAPDRPEQFAALLGGRSLLRQTVDRVRLAVAAERTVVVTLKDHESHLAEALRGAQVGRALVQPEDKGTAAGVLLSTHWIHGRDPDAIVAVFPSDHFVKEERKLTDHVADVADVVREHPGWMVLLGAPPTDPEPDYGWIEPGHILARSPAGSPIHWVRQFWEKPSPLIARACLDKGWLVSTCVIVAKASLILEVGAQLLPQLHERLSLNRPVKDTELEHWILQRGYGLVQKTSFSEAVLEHCPSCLVVSRLPALTWSDWGTPERVLKSLRRAGLVPREFSESDLVRDLSAEALPGRKNGDERAPRRRAPGTARARKATTGE
jgi:mannose-1-phosphate guanylyltransferase